SLKAGAGEWAVATVVGILFFGVLAATATFTVWPTTPPDRVAAANSPTTQQLGSAFLGATQAMPKANLTGYPAGVTPAPRQEVAYLLPFEIVSVHLLVVLIGAAYLARAKRRREVVA